MRFESYGFVSRITRGHARRAFSMHFIQRKLVDVLMSVKLDRLAVGLVL